MRAITMMMAATAIAMTLMGCTKKENTGMTEAEVSQRDSTEKEAYTEDFYIAVDSVLDTYLLFDADQLAERMRIGNEMAGMEPSEGENSVKELAAAANELHRSCKALLKEHNTKALHDTMFENWQTFIASPNSNLEVEGVLIPIILAMTGTEYPNDSIRFYTEAEELFDWRAFHFWTVEKLRQGEVNIPDGHIEAIMDLMFARIKLGKYDESIKTGEEFIEHLKQYSPQHEAIEMIEYIIEDARERKENQQ